MGAHLSTTSCKVARLDTIKNQIISVLSKTTEHLQFKSPTSDTEFYVIGSVYGDLQALYRFFITNDMIHLGSGGTIDWNFKNNCMVLQCGNQLSNNRYPHQDVDIGVLLFMEFMNRISEGRVISIIGRSEIHNLQGNFNAVPFEDMFISESIDGELKTLLDEYNTNISNYIKVKPNYHKTKDYYNFCKALLSIDFTKYSDDDAFAYFNKFAIGVDNDDETISGEIKRSFHSAFDSGIDKQLLLLKSKYKDLDSIYRIYYMRRKAEEFVYNNRFKEIEKFKRFLHARPIVQNYNNMILSHVPYNKDYNSIWKKNNTAPVEFEHNQVVKAYNQNSKIPPIMDGHLQIISRDNDTGTDTVTITTNTARSLELQKDQQIYISKPAVLIQSQHDTTLTYIHIQDNSVTWRDIEHGVQGSDNPLSSLCNEQFNNFFRHHILPELFVSSGGSTMKKTQERVSINGRTRIVYRQKSTKYIKWNKTYQKLSHIQAKYSTTKNIVQ